MSSESDRQIILYLEGLDLEKARRWGCEALLAGHCSDRVPKDSDRVPKSLKRTPSDVISPPEWTTLQAGGRQQPDDTQVRLTAKLYTALTTTWLEVLDMIWRKHRIVVQSELFKQLAKLEESEYEERIYKRIDALPFLSAMNNPHSEVRLTIMNTSPYGPQMVKNDQNGVRQNLEEK